MMAGWPTRSPGSTITFAEMRIRKKAISIFA